jgi:hypothetical protein
LNLVIKFLTLSVQISSDVRVGKVYGNFTHLLVPVRLLTKPESRTRTGTTIYFYFILWFDWHLPVHLTNPAQASAVLPPSDHLLHHCF